MFKQNFIWHVFGMTCHMLTYPDKTEIGKCWDLARRIPASQTKFRATSSFAPGYEHG